MFKRVIKEEWTFPAEIDHLGEMRDSVMHFGRKHGISEQVINAFKLAIDEAGTNIIRHAYRDWEGAITMRMIIRDKDVTVSLVDQGHSFDPRQVKDPDLQRYVHIGKKGGLGIFIIRRVIDKIDYRKLPEGNELRLTKSRKTGMKRLRTPEIPFSMKTRFSALASVLLTALMLIWFIWTYLHLDNKIRNDALASGETLARSVGHQSIEYLSYDPPNWWDLSTIVTDIHREYHPRIVEIIVVDTINVIQGVVNLEALHNEFILPAGANPIRDHVYQFQHDGVRVYDVVEPALKQVDNRNIRLGTVHVLMNKQMIDATIKSERQFTLIKAILALAFGYLFTFGLVYLTMSPFKKLSKWVRDLGHGEVRDEMEFDGNDEIGEIAQAFNEITEKFRKSQENLAEQERLQKEMQVAQEIQHTLLPATFPEIDGYEIASCYEAAKEVGGDYFDFFRVDRDSLGIVVADVSGKGVPGSLVMTMIRTALRTEARGNKNAADVLSKVNDFVINDMKRGMFVTVFYIILDSKRRTINYASAGHNPMILYRGQSQKSYYLNPRGFPIGINLPDQTLFRNSIESDTLQLRPDDVLIVYTDGITEAMDINRNRFGDERFLSVIRKAGDQKVEPLVESIKQEIYTFTGGEPQSDDITLVAIREKMSVEEVFLNIHTDLLRMVQKEGMTVKEACEKAGVSTSTYYKYKKLYEKNGEQGMKDRVGRSLIEEKHIAIEDKAKIFDVIKTHPEYGPKRIRDELNTEKYGFFQIDEARLYEELVRNRLNTKELRMAFVERGGRGKRMKTPGTPMLTLDGRVIISPTLRKPAPSKPSPGTSLPEKKTPETDHLQGKPAEKQPEIAVSRGAPPEHKEAEEHPSVQETPEVTVQPPGDKDLAEAIERDFTGIASEDDGESAGDDEEISAMEADWEELDVESESEQPHPENIDEALTERMGEPSSDPRDDFSFESLVDDSSGLLIRMDDSFDDPLAAGDDSGDVLPEAVTESGDDPAFFPLMSGFLSDGSQESLIDELIGEENQDSGRKESGITGEIFDETDMEIWTDSLLGEGSDLETRQPAILEANPENARRLNRMRFLESGQWFYQEGLFARAIEEFNKAIACDQKFGAAYHAQGDAYFRLGQLEKAKRAYTAARELMPDNVHILENLGVIYANQGDYKRAVWQWGEVLKRDPMRGDIVERIKRMQRLIRQRAVYQKKS
ncbi:MAG TPA: tetratricopeptide repeat protein [bacterium]|nr:tetratricopeptide repeat protein [bacterium]